MASESIRRHRPAAVAGARPWSVRAGGDPGMTLPRGPPILPRIREKHRLGTTARADLAAVARDVQALAPGRDGLPVPAQAAGNLAIRGRTKDRLFLWGE